MAKFGIVLVGLEDDGLPDVTVDGVYHLVQYHPDPEIYVHPPRGCEHPDFRTVAFYADCLSFEHDAPSFPLATSSILRSLAYTPNLALRGSAARDQFVRSQIEVLAILHGIRLGYRYSIAFRWYDENRRVDLPYGQRFGNLCDAVHSYSAALRQTDPLSEFLWYYRVLENLSGNNGKQWITSNVARIGNCRVPRLTAADSPEGFRTVNLLSRLHARAGRRLEQLRKLVGSDDKIARYLYHTNRCGIAHGGAKLRRSDFQEGYFEVARDNSVAKLLARLAIEDRIPARFEPVRPIVCHAVKLRRPRIE